MTNLKTEHPTPVKNWSDEQLTKYLADNLVTSQVIAAQLKFYESVRKEVLARVKKADEAGHFAPDEEVFFGPDGEHVVVVEKHPVIQSLNASPQVLLQVFGDALAPVMNIPAKAFIERFGKDADPFVKVGYGPRRIKTIR